MHTVILEELRTRLSIEIRTAISSVRWMRSPLRPVTRRYLAAHGRVVKGGPFAGMRYHRAVPALSAPFVAKLLGIYESELDDSLERLIGGEFSTIINIGSAEGYYAVGLARRCPQATVHAFELDPLYRKACRAMAADNGVADRVEVRGPCDEAALRGFPAIRALVLCDCEGGELGMLKPDIPLLGRSTMVVELHDFIYPGTEEEILDRFGATHEAEVITARARYYGEYPEVMALRNTIYVDWQMAVSEFRPFEMRWVVLTPRAHG